MQSQRKTSTKIPLQQLTFCAISIALATISSFIKLASLPFGGSITFFSMFFITLTGYFFGFKSGVFSGITFGIVQFLLGPYIYTPLQAILDYPVAFGALGFSGLFQSRKYGLTLGFLTGATSRYLIHVISGYLFFHAYAPETLNPLLYTFGYNLTYILPEVIVTTAILCIPTMQQRISHLKHIVRQVD